MTKSEISNLKYNSITDPKLLVEAIEGLKVIISETEECMKSTMARHFSRRHNIPAHVFANLLK